VGCGLRTDAEVRNVAARGKVVYPVFVTRSAVEAVVGGCLVGWVYVVALSVMGPPRGFGCGLGVFRSDRVRVCEQTNESVDNGRNFPRLFYTLSFDCTRGTQRC